MDSNKLHDDCRKCLNKKESIINKMINNFKLGPFLIWSSIIVGVITLIIRLLPFIGVTGAILLICAAAFVIGLFIEIFLW